MAVVRNCVWTGLILGVIGAFLGSEAARADLVSGTATGSGSAGQGAKKTELDLAQEAFTSGNFAGALELFRKAAEKNKDMSPPQVIMARLYANVSNVNLGAMARNALEAAVVEDPKDPEAYLILASLAINERRWTDADLLLEKAADVLASFKGSEVRRKAMEPQVVSGQAAVYEARANWKAARKSLERLVALESGNVASHQRLARVLFQEGSYDEALKQLKKAADVPQSATINPRIQMALLYEQIQKHELAKTEMSLGLKEDSTAPAMLTAARWAVDCGEIEEAKRYAGKALQAEPKSLDAKMMLGVIAYVSKDYSKAEDYFQQILSEVPANAVAANNLALALCEQNDQDKKNRAIQHALTVAQRAPRSGEAQSTLGWACFKAGNKQQAVASMQSAVQIGQMSRDAAYFAAAVFADAGAKDAAKQLLEQALSQQAQGPFSRMQEARALQDQLKK